jgi:hypothetical protein
MLNIKEIDSRKKITEKRLIIEDGDGKSINGLCSIYIRNNKLIYVSNETGNPPYYDCGEQTVYSYDFKNGTNAVLFSCPSTITCLASSEYVYETYEYDIETNEYMTKYYDEQGNIISTKIKASNDCLDEETKLYEDDNYIVLNQYYEVDSIQHKKYYIVNKNDGASYTILDLDATNVIAYMSDTPVFDTELKEFTIVKDKLYYIELTSYSDLSLSTKQKIEIIDLERVVR